VSGLSDLGIQTFVPRNTELVPCFHLVFFSRPYFHDSTNPPCRDRNKLAMAGEEDHDVRLPALTLPLRSKTVDGDGDALTPVIHTAVPPSLVSPGIKVELYGDPVMRPGLIHPRSAPPNVQSFQSPMRHHRRTPSAHREIIETLNARSEYTNEDADGRSHHHLNQYVIGDEIGRGSYGAVHLATDQFGNEYAVKAFSKSRLRKRAQSNILRNGPRQLGRFHRAGFGAPDAPILGLKAQQAKEAKDALFLIREEIAIMKKLNHPNLVQLMEVLDDSEDDSLYMVMEMCKKGVVMKIGLGESATPYEEEQCRHWFRDLILGIEYCEYSAAYLFTQKTYLCCKRSALARSCPP
jgi:[calcium/calmodulin-dependent protein kinase] kinase